MLPESRRLLICLLFYLNIFLINGKTYQKASEEDKSDEKFKRNAEKKPRSVQFSPQYSNIYGRPVRLIPKGPYRVPGVQRLNTIATLPGLPRTYIPMVRNIAPSSQPRYLLPYQIASVQAPRPQIINKPYIEKYNNLPAIPTSSSSSSSNSVGNDENVPELTRKIEDKSMDLGDEFDHFLDSLDGPCSKNPCKNDGKCRVTHDGASYFCVCKKGYKGKSCQDKNPCFPNPCANAGECTLTNEGFECSCSKGFKGQRCEQQNTCEPNPCENDGVCNEIENGGFECTCNKGFHGDKCQVIRKSCDPNPCKNNGHCSETGDQGYECTCVDGYTGPTCDGLADKCSENPCKNGGHCSLTTSSVGYECSCPHGYKGMNCEDHSGCGEDSCQNGGTCYETESGVKCICKNGYSGDKCQVRKRCEPDTCQNDGRCIEHVNGFYCKCGDGYRGKTCEELDQCRPNPCLHGGRCEQSDVGYTCKCSEEYRGENCEILDPCSLNPCKNGGKCSAGTMNGYYQCQCFDGYQGRHCEERDVCDPNPCQNSGVCRRNGEDFSCECREGLQGKNCEKSNPCRENPCQNAGTCQQDGEDNFLCLCQEEFKGTRCEVRKPCFDNPCMNNGKCEEREDSFVCSCQDGYRGEKCEEIDQCHLLNPCKNGARCTPLMTSGSSGKRYRCDCVNNYYGDTCEERNACHPNPCANNGLCAEINGGFTCQCRSGFKGDRCHEIDRCNPNPCQHSGSCSEVIGGLGYACKCPYGYKGENCEQKDYCHPNPCDHDGQCIPSTTGFQCKCSFGFIGQRCQDTNPCEPNPCLHSSQCLILPGFAKNHECNCTVGWSGDTCQKREICQPNPCQFGRKCVETGEDSYSCVKSMCHPNPCENNGKCININENNYQCACTENFEGKVCEVPKQKQSTLSRVPNRPSAPSDIFSQLLGTNPVSTRTQLATSINPPAARPPNIPLSSVARCSPLVCQNDGICIQEAGEPIKCKCKASFTGETCQYSKCVTKPCQNQGLCVPVDRDPGFVCKCRDGHTGPLCSRKPCQPNPCQNGGDCVMFYSVYLCKCKAGFQGKHCEGTSETKAFFKEQSNDVVTSLHSNNVCNPSPCQNNGRCIVSSDGEYECICAQRYSGPKCEDEGVYKYSSAPKFFPGDNEECKHCDANARCVNGHCICRNKYVGDGLECWKETSRDRQWSCDTNPCQNGGTCKPGIARCVCRLGFVGDYCEMTSKPVVHLSFDHLTGDKLLDDSGNQNDAIITSPFQIATNQGKCYNAGNLLGGEVRLDGSSFRKIPREAITIAIWVKLNTAYGIQSIFDTIGSHSTHKDGQYHFEIDNGRLRWFHRNEMRTTVFSVISDGNVMKEGHWVFVVGTYSAKNNRARIYVDGDLIQERPGRGLLLSGDWGLKAGIGKHEHEYGARILRGMVDEFTIFPAELSRLQILVLMKHCKVYYNDGTPSRKTANQKQETFTEMTPVTSSYTTSNQGMTSQPATGSQQYAGYTTSTSNLEHNQPSQVTPPYNQAPPSYYGNNLRAGYQVGDSQSWQANTGGETGYQRSQKPVTPINYQGTSRMNINTPSYPRVPPAPVTNQQYGYYQNPPINPVLTPSAPQMNPAPSSQQPAYTRTQTPTMNYNIPQGPPMYYVDPQQTPQGSSMYSASPQPPSYIPQMNQGTGYETNVQTTWQNSGTQRSSINDGYTSPEVQNTYDFRSNTASNNVQGALAQGSAGNMRYSAVPSPQYNPGLSVPARQYQPITNTQYSPQQTKTWSQAYDDVSMTSQNNGIRMMPENVDARMTSQYNGAVMTSQNNDVTLTSQNKAWPDGNAWPDQAVYARSKVFANNKRKGAGNVVNTAPNSALKQQTTAADGPRGSQTSPNTAPHNTGTGYSSKSNIKQLDANGQYPQQPGTSYSWPIGTQAPANKLISTAGWSQNTGEYDGRKPLQNSQSITGRKSSNEKLVNKIVLEEERIKDEPGHQTLAKNIAVDPQNVYKRTMLAKRLTEER